MVQSYKWKPDPTLWEKVVDLARQRGQSPEAIMDEAVERYLEESLPSSKEVTDTLVGLYDGSPDTASNAESILQEAASNESGWTWKETSP